MDNNDPVIEEILSFVNDFDANDGSPLFDPIKKERITDLSQKMN
jgi:hypothetical protein